MRIFKPKSNLHVGLDITPPWLRLLLLRHTRQGFSIEGFVVTELPERTQPLVTSSASIGKPTTIALGVNNVVTKRIKLPKFLNALEVEKQVAAEIHQHVPGIADELCFDFVNLGLADAEHHDILLIATRQELLNNTVAWCNRSGLDVRCVEVDIHALARAACWCLQQQNHLLTFAIVDISATTTQLLLLADNKIIFQQVLSFGMTAIQSFTVSAHQFLLNLQLQLKRIQAQCFANEPLTTVQKIILTGEGSLIPGLVAAVQEKLGIATTCLNPFQHMTVADTVNKQQLFTLAPTLLTCCGLAMRRLP